MLVEVKKQKNKTEERLPKKSTRLTGEVGVVEVGAKRSWFVALFFSQQKNTKNSVRHTCFDGRLHKILSRLTALTPPTVRW